MDFERFSPISSRNDWCAKGPRRVLFSRDATRRSSFRGLAGVLAYLENIISVNHPRVYPHTYLTNSFLPRSREQGYASRRSTDLAGSDEIIFRRLRVA